MENHEGDVVSLSAFSAYDLPSVKALVLFFHASAGYPVKATWLKAIKTGFYRSWPGLTYSNASKYCPAAVPTTKGHMTQVRQGVRSTKQKTTVHKKQEQEEMEPEGTEPPDNDSGNNLTVKVFHQSKLYTDDTGRFPVKSRAGNQYIMVAYHSSNLILAQPFASRKDKHRIAAYDAIMTKLKAANLDVDLQVLDNEASKEYKDTMINKWKVKYQLVPPDMHRRNAAERAIRTFKAHFISILAGVDLDFPSHLWDLLVPQAEMTQNLLRPCTSDPTISAWENFNGELDYNANPLGPLGIRVLIHNKPSRRKSWDMRALDGWSIGTSLEHYRCQKVVTKDSRAVRISDTVEFRHHRITTPMVTPEDRVIRSIEQLTAVLKGDKLSATEAQMKAIETLQSTLNNWSDGDWIKENKENEEPVKVNQQSPRVLKPLRPRMARAPRVRRTLKPSSPRVPQPIAHRTRSKTKVEDKQQPKEQPIAHRTRSRVKNNDVVTAIVSDLLAASVMDQETGEMLEFRQLRRHPKYKKIWETSYANELGRLCQGVGTNKKDPTQKRVKGTDTFRVIRFEDIPPAKRRQVCHTSVVCEIRPDKDDPNRTRITVAGNRIIYPGDVATRTGGLELVKLMINSVLSKRGAKAVCYDIKNFYLDTPMDEPEYVRIKLKDVPKEFLEEYNLKEYEHNGWIYFEIVKASYGLPQSGKLSNDLLRERLAEDGYYEAETPGLWKHVWRPIQFVLVVDDFFVEYVGKQHAEHLAKVLKKYHTISEDWKAKKFVGIDLEWNFAKKHSDRSCRLSMKNYIADLLFKLKHPNPRKPQKSPHKWREIEYGSKVQLSPDEDKSEPLDEEEVKWVQMVVGALLYYGRAVDNKLLTALSAIGSQQSKATENTKKAVNMLLDYCATYPNDGITYRSSDMTLCGHSDAGFNNESGSRSRAGAHIFLSEEDTFPRWNGPVLSIAQVMKYILSSAAEAETAALFLTATEMVSLRNTLDEMGWKQPPSPLQCDNSTAVGYTNKTIISKKSKQWDLRLRWLRCRTAQDQFRIYWDKGTNNNGDYHTKHHPPCYHESKRSLGFAGAVLSIDLSSFFGC